MHLYLIWFACVFFWSFSFGIEWLVPHPRWWRLFVWLFKGLQRLCKSCISLKLCISTQHTGEVFLVSVSLCKMFSMISMYSFFQTLPCESTRFVKVSKMRSDPQQDAAMSRPINLFLDNWNTRRYSGNWRKSIGFIIELSSLNLHSFSRFTYLFFSAVLLQIFSWTNAIYTTLPITYQSYNHPYLNVCK